jgi:hypothetical protein
MTTLSAHPFVAKSRLSWTIPLALMAGLALLGMLICFAGQKNLQTETANGYSPSTLFNQANADARAGKTAQAILAYERAAFLAPEDANIRANLNWVRIHAGLPALVQTPLERSVSWVSPNALAWLGTLGLILIAFLVVTGACGLTLLALAITSAVLAWQTSQQAVVLTTDAPARIAPTTVSEAAFKLPAGALATMEGRHDNFILVADASGHTGWVSRSDLEPILSNKTASPL